MSSPKPASKSPTLGQRAGSRFQTPQINLQTEEEEEDHAAEIPEDDDEYPYPEPTADAPLLPPPNFNPFFTMIEDANTGETHHPYVHYVFADDDPSIITAAAMRSLGLDDTQYLPAPAPAEDEQGQHTDKEQQFAESPLPPPIPGLKEHYVLVDIGADGRTIVDAQSLSPEWAISKTQIRPAPSFSDESSQQELMLKIDGVEVPKRSKGKGKGLPGEQKFLEAKEKAGGDVFSALEGLVKGVEENMAVAKKIAGGAVQKKGENEADREEGGSTITAVKQEGTITAPGKVEERKPSEERW